VIWIGSLILREPFCTATAGVVLAVVVGIPVVLSVADWKRSRAKK